MDTKDRIFLLKELGNVPYTTFVNEVIRMYPRPNAVRTASHVVAAYEKKIDQISDRIRKQNP